jgi:hypothetical protein
MLYFIITTSILNNCSIRKEQYIDGIYRLINVINQEEIKNCKIIIVENNGNRETYLDQFNKLCNLHYTNNNFLNTQNKGVKELEDILSCINYYNIKDTDFIVKITGRYKIQDNSEFIKILKTYIKWRL